MANIGYNFSLWYQNVKYWHTGNYHIKLFIILTYYFIFSNILRPNLQNDVFTLYDDKKQKNNVT